MKKILENPYFNLTLRLILGLYFVFVAMDKIADPTKFAMQIRHYEILPVFAVNSFAIVLPWIELVAGFLLAAGIRIRANSVIIGSMLIVFIIAITSAVLRGLNIDCGCSSRSVQVGLPKIFEDIVWLFVSYYLFKYPLSRFSAESLASRENSEKVSTT